MVGHHREVVTHHHDQHRQGQIGVVQRTLLAGGAKGKRYCLPHSNIMIHQPSGGFQGQATDIDIHAREVLSLRQRMAEILSEHCDKDVEQVHKDIDRDYYMTAAEAKEYGLVDEIIVNRRAQEELAKVSTLSS